MFAIEASKNCDWGGEEKEEDEEEEGEEEEEEEEEYRDGVLVIGFARLLLRQLLALLSSSLFSSDEEVLLGEEARDETPDGDKGSAAGTQFTRTSLCSSTHLDGSSSPFRSDAAAALSSRGISTMDVISR